MLAFASFGSAAMAAVAPIADDSGLVLHGTYGSDTDVTRTAATASPVGDVKPGETFAITGACVMELGSADNVRVVLTTADATNGNPGYHAVIATDNSYRDNTLHVRTPDMAEVANRVFNVKLFIIDQDSPEICNAGAIRIGAQTTIAPNQG